MKCKHLPHEFLESAPVFSGALGCVTIPLRPPVKIRDNFLLHRIGIAASVLSVLFPGKNL